MFFSADVDEGEDPGLLVQSAVRAVYALVLVLTSCKTPKAEKIAQGIDVQARQRKEREKDCKRIEKG